MKKSLAAHASPSAPRLPTAPAGRRLGLSPDLAPAPRLTAGAALLAASCLSLIFLAGLGVAAILG